MEHVPEGYDKLNVAALPEVTGTKDLATLAAADSWLKFQRAGLFGQCEARYPVKFMQNLAVTECAVEANTCADLQFEKIGILDIFSQSQR